MRSHGAAQALAEVFHLSWAVPVLAEASRLDGTVGGLRVAMLRRRLPVSRPSLDRTLCALVEDRGWLAPNPGYGHPLRPEFVLTPAGRPLARWCGLYTAVVEKVAADVDTLPDLAYRKWTAPLLEAIRAVRGGARFSNVQAALPGATPRAISLGLDALVTNGLIERTVEAGHPPHTRYRLLPEGRRIANVTRRFAGRG